MQPPPPPAPPSRTHSHTHAHACTSLPCVAVDIDGLLDRCEYFIVHFMEPTGMKRAGEQLQKHINVRFPVSRVVVAAAADAAVGVVVFVTGDLGVYFERD